MEDNLFKAITIGAALIITMTAVSLGFVYYNVAREGATNVGQRTNIYMETEDIFFQKLQKLIDSNNSEITGTEARNVIFEMTSSDYSVNVNYLGNGGVIISDINKLTDPITGQPDYLRVNNLILPTDKYVIDATISNNRSAVTINLRKINKL